MNQATKPGRRTAAPPGARVVIDGAAKQALEIGRNRLFVIAAVFALGFTVISGRVVDVMALKGGAAPKSAAVAVEQPDRAAIRDRNGELLATSLGTASLFADATQVSDPATAARQLKGVLPELNEADVRTKLTSERRFIWIHRNLTPRQQYAVNRLGIPGLSFQREARRVYPQGAMAAHVVGFTDVDGKGIAGIERSFDGALAAGTAPIDLSLDMRVQHAVVDELTNAIKDFNAVGGVGVVLDVRSGEVLALASLPDFDPNHPGDVKPEDRFNRATLGVYEMGSTFKTFVIAGALDSGTATLKSGYDATNPIHIGRFTIEDYHAKRRWLSVPEIYIHSSNIGAAKMALDLGTPQFRAFLHSVGFNEPSPLEVPEVGKPMSPAQWRDINTMTIAFGHGMAVSPIQLASATAAMINGGILVQPTLIKRTNVEGAMGARVISRETSADMRKLMRLVVEQGTAKSADVPGYLVGGKTGTAEKTGVGGYKKKSLLSSFIGAFPMNDPRYLVLVMLDEPKGNKQSYGYATGGWVAAPAAGRIVRRIGPMLGVEPVDDTTPEMKKEMFVVVNPRAPTLASY
ncbi:MAG: penicillin-binding protein 2 [Alphaproteobacteria bacterium]|nr:penicillin-binding protein 2 [Alphaproteobacteria bacterium]